MPRVDIRLLAKRIRSNDVLAFEPARLPPQLKVKAEALKSGKPPPPEPASDPKAPGDQKKK